MVRFHFKWNKSRLDLLIRSFNMLVHESHLGPTFAQNWIGVLSSKVSHLEQFPWEPFWLSACLTHLPLSTIVYTHNITGFLLPTYPRQFFSTCTSYMCMYIRTQSSILHLLPAASTFSLFFDIRSLSFLWAVWFSRIEETNPILSLVQLHVTTP